MLGFLLVSELQVAFPLAVQLFASFVLPLSVSPQGPIVVALPVAAGPFRVGVVSEGLATGSLGFAHTGGKGGNEALLLLLTSCSLGPSGRRSWRFLLRAPSKAAASAEVRPIFRASTIHSGESPPVTEEDMIGLQWAGLKNADLERCLEEGLRVGRGRKTEEKEAKA